MKQDTIFLDFEPQTNKFINIHTQKLDELKELLFGFLGDDAIMSLEGRQRCIPKNRFRKGFEYYWDDMPEYEASDDDVNTRSITIRWNDNDETQQETIKEMLRFFENPMVRNNAFTYPKTISKSVAPFYWSTTETRQPKYPIYIISKGRYDKRPTSDYLEFCGIDYKIVVEPQEAELYAKHIDQSKILILPDEYLGKNQGGIPARNFVWKHSKATGAKRHWILDDNIFSYVRINRGKKIVMKCSTAFTALEDFVDRLDDVKMAGHNYTFFNISSQPQSVITVNTRIYSSILLSNDLDLEWRGRYNEDTDLSLRILKMGHTTILFNAFTANKATTMTCKGGNTTTIYAEPDAHLKKSQQLVDFHPDCAKVMDRFGRKHHYVNYTKFHKPLKLRDDYERKIGENELGMFLIPKATTSLFKLD